MRIDQSQCRWNRLKILAHCAGGDSLFTWCARFALSVRIETSLMSGVDPNSDQEGLKIPPKPSKYPHSYEELDANGPPRIEEDGAK